jgi:hypothetical protein
MRLVPAQKRAEAPPNSWPVMRQPQDVIASLSIKAAARKIFQLGEFLDALMQPLAAQSQFLKPAARRDVPRLSLSHLLHVDVPLDDKPTSRI